MCKVSNFLTCKIDNNGEPGPMKSRAGHILNILICPWMIFWPNRFLIILTTVIQRILTITWSENLFELRALTRATACKGYNYTAMDHTRCWRPAVVIACVCLFVVLFCLCFPFGLSRVDSGTPGGFSNDGGGGAGPQQSVVPHGVSLSLSTADPTPAGSPDPSSLTVLQPANNNQNNGTVYAAAASTMLPGFTTHYGTTGKCSRRDRNRFSEYPATKPDFADHVWLVIFVTETENGSENRNRNRLEFVFQSLWNCSLKTDNLFLIFYYQRYRNPYNFLQKYTSEPMVLVLHEH